jgi:hypothetical protein
MGGTAVINDSLIRHEYHNRALKRYRSRLDTLVVDELGLKHGRCRADIAVIGKRLHGYEIKGEKDSFRRLEGQVEAYNAVFDHISIILAPCHASAAVKRVPQWWGIIVCRKGSRGGIAFETLRKSRQNHNVDPLSVAQLLWKDEAQAVLRRRGVMEKTLRQPRSVLYNRLTELLDIGELRLTVRACLKNRRNWRRHELPSQYDGSFRPIARS